MDKAIVELLTDWMNDIRSEVNRWNERLTDERWGYDQEVIEAIILRLETRLAFLQRQIKTNEREGSDD